MAATEKANSHTLAPSQVPTLVQFLIVFLATLLTGWWLLPEYKGWCIALALITATHHILPHSLCQCIARRAPAGYRRPLQCLALFCTTALLVTLHHTTQHHLT